MVTKKEQEMLKVIQKRFSPYSFDPAYVLPEEKLLKLMESAVRAPSSFNEQPWRYVWAVKGSDEFCKIYETLMPANQKWAINASALAIICFVRNFTKNNKPNFWAQYDTGASAYSLTCEAVQQGLHIHQMGGFSKEKARDNLRIPLQIEPIAALAIGKAVEKPSEPSKRKPLEEVCFRGVFGVPFPPQEEEATATPAESAPLKTAKGF